LKHSRILKFEKETEDASTTNDIWNITNRFIKHQTQLHAPVIQGRKGLTYTPMDNATAIAEV
jgi:hypothetical protein